jgi:hypothetical protein
MLSHGRSWSPALFALLACSDADEVPCGSIQGYIAESSPYGTEPIFDTSGIGKMLEVVPDRVAAVTRRGERIDCPLEGDASYRCLADPGLRTITVHIGEQAWTRRVEGLECDDYWRWEFTIGPSISFWLDDIAPCVPDGTTVVQGSLLGYDPSFALLTSVVLEGTPQSFDVEKGFHTRQNPVLTPSIPCEIEGDSYRCPALGYRQTMDHQVVVKVGTRVTRTELTLPVEDCRAEPVQQDITACAVEPEPLRVDFGSGEVFASHDGGSLYRCVADPSFPFGYECPPGAESAHGEGRYDVFAERAGLKYAGSVTRVYNGCYVDPTPLRLERITP